VNETSEIFLLKALIFKMHLARFIKHFNKYLISCHGLCNIRNKSILYILVNLVGFTSFRLEKRRIDEPNIPGPL
jgi:hypothetical protein